MVYDVGVYLHQLAVLDCQMHLWTSKSTCRWVSRASSFSDNMNNIVIKLHLVIIFRRNEMANQYKTMFLQRKAS